jgi:Amt family ammonium transporter
MKELIAVVGTSIYAFVFTYLMLVLINKITRVRVTAEEEEEGLDSSYHGESARDTE